MLDTLKTSTVQKELKCSYSVAWRVKDLLKSKTIIVDSTHTKSVYNPKTPIEILQYVCFFNELYYFADFTKCHTCNSISTSIINGDSARRRIG